LVGSLGDCFCQYHVLLTKIPFVYTLSQVGHIEILPLYTETVMNYISPKRSDTLQLGESNSGSGSDEFGDSADPQASHLCFLRLTNERAGTGSSSNLIN
ncbi:hypothetical protein DSO57_1026959, partial [Entomophthora muscae]